MMTRLKFAVAMGLAYAASPAHAQVINQKSLSAGAALVIAQTAYEACTQQGYQVSVHVVGREGQVLVAIRGDGSSPHTLENSLRKALTDSIHN